MIKLFCFGCDLCGSFNTGTHIYSFVLLLFHETSNVNDSKLKWNIFKERKKKKMFYFPIDDDIFVI